ncbi:MAG TPA: hypothetical protein VJS12_07430 [Steroidobacteraceae bacterium]|nr:hypothetical protein [Steroidobacteraceae bacterium]
MKSSALAIALIAWCAAAAAAAPSRVDRGWMTNNMGGQCQMLRGVWAANPANAMLTVTVYSEPLGATKPTGQAQLLLALFVNQRMQNGNVESFAILESRDAAAGKYTITPEPKRGISSLLGTDADEALRLFAAERFVRAKMKDGTTIVFSFPPNGYEIAKPMFDACSKKPLTIGR